MRIEITAGGIYGANGEIPVGTEMTVKNEPKGWKGRYRVLGKSDGKEPVTNPAQTDVPKTAAEALALFSAEGVHVNTAKAKAKAFLGEKVADDASKDDIVKALEELATQPE